jgi:hypothetical protein
VLCGRDAIWVNMRHSLSSFVWISDC